MAKNDGFAEVRDHHFLEPFGFQVIINHFEEEPEIWDTFKSEEEAIEEVFKWNNGLWGEGFTHSAEELKRRAIEEAKEK